MLHGKFKKCLPIPKNIKSEYRGEDREINVNESIVSLKQDPIYNLYSSVLLNT